MVPQENAVEHLDVTAAMDAPPPGRLIELPVLALFSEEDER